MDKSHSLSTPIAMRSLDVEKYPFRPPKDEEDIIGPEVPYLSESCGVYAGNEGPTSLHEDNAACIAQLKEWFIKGTKVHSARLLECEVTSTSSMEAMAQEKPQEDDQDDAKGEEKRKFVPRRNVVNFLFTNFPSEWNTANLLELFEEVVEVADVYVAKKMSKVGQKFRFAHFYRVGNLQALENRLNRIRIGRFKLRANIARFERGHYKSKQGCNKVDWVFDIPPTSNQKATGNITLSKSQNGNLKYKDFVGESFLIHSISELQPIWQSFNTKDCKVSNLGGQRILLDFKRIGGCVSTNCFGSKRFVEKGGKIDTDEAINLAQGCFDDKSGEMDASIGEEPKSGAVTPASVLQSEGKHLDFRPKAGSEYIVCEEI
ncbi:nucleotide-binding alpha-beta plait domain-containing protein, partial [Tanacetum coccineum]